LHIIIYNWRSLVCVLLLAYVYEKKESCERMHRSIRVGVLRGQIVSMQMGRRVSEGWSKALYEGQGCLCT
jgi:hypothetical protein